MRKPPAISISFLLVTGVLVSLPPMSFGEEGAWIGEYERLGFTGDLEPGQVTSNESAMLVEAPPLTDRLRISETYLEENLGHWAADREFAQGSGVVEFEGSEAEFVTFALNAEPLFTWGDHDQIQFQERPMWVSATQEEPGGTITLNMDDGDSSGQQVYISRAWLRDRGIPRPNITHEDGTVLDVEASGDDAGYFFYMHHFSSAFINPDDLDVLGRQGGLVFPHLEERRWYPEEYRLEVDVDQKTSDYEVMVEADWVLDHFEPRWSSHDTWYLDQYLGTDYYVLPLGPEQTPVTILLQQTFWLTHEFNFDFADFSDRVSQGLPVVLPLGPQNNTEFVLDAAPPYTITISTDGVPEEFSLENLSVVTPTDAVGNLVSTSSGFLGRIVFEENREEYHFRPSGDLSNYHVQFISPEVLCSRILMGDECIWDHDPPPPGNEGYPYAPPYSPSTVAADPRVYIDSSTCLIMVTCELAAAHINSALSLGRTMWLDYAGIDVSTPTDFDHVGNLVQEDCFSTWDAFDIHLGSSAGDAFLLFVSANWDGTFGCVTRVDTPAILANPPATVNVVADDIGYGYFGASNTRHMGLLAGHEIGHAWGEPKHRCGYVNAQLSLMCDSTDWEAKQFWLHYSPAADYDCEQSTEATLLGYRGLDEFCA